MTRNKRDICRELKEAYGLEHLWFYYIQGWQLFGCRFTASDDFSLEDALDPTDLDFLLKSLSMQQGKVYFDDVKQVCVGMDELKTHYLPIKLAGIK
jgi:hypothetical protein